MKNLYMLILVLLAGTAYGQANLSAIDASTCLNEKSSDTVVSFSTMSNGSANEGKGRNGIYTEVLIKELKNSNATIDEVLKKISIAVKQKTSGSQIPSSYSSISSDCFNQLHFKDALKAYPTKFAIVIGNSDYKRIGRLPNSINDSSDIAQYFLSQ